MDCGAISTKTSLTGLAIFVFSGMFENLPQPSNGKSEHPLLQCSPLLLLLTHAIRRQGGIY